VLYELRHVLHQQLQRVFYEYLVKKIQIFANWRVCNEIWHVYITFGRFLKKNYCVSNHFYRVRKPILLPRVCVFPNLNTSQSPDCRQAAVCFHTCGHFYSHSAHSVLKNLPNWMSMSLFALWMWLCLDGSCECLESMEFWSIQFQIFAARLNCR
jgi:hypothetical protein